MRHRLIKIIALPVILSVLAGILSGSIVFIYLFSYMNMGDILIGAKTSGKVVALPRTIDKETKKAVLNSLITFYKTKKQSALVADNIYLEGGQLGYGFIITSDGWVMTNGNILGWDYTQVSAVVGDGKVYSIKKIEKDPMSDAVFVRLEASNLTPIAFGDPHDLQLGEDLYLFDSEKRVKKVSFQGFGYDSSTSKVSLCKSSEKFEKNLFFEEISSTFGGAPLLNYRGEVVGVIKEGSGQITKNAISFSHAYLSMQNLFRNSRIARIFLGVQYIDLAHVRSVDANLPNRGALVSSGVSRVGVLKYSPAWNAGLKEGDIIIKVGSDELNGEYNLSERIAEYHSGDVVDFTILRDDKEQIIQIKLEEL